MTEENSMLYGLYLSKGREDKLLLLGLQNTI